MDLRTLCTSPACRSRGHHWQDCDNSECTGCQPRQAADASNLCHACGRRLGEDITALAELHTALAHTLAGGSSGEKVATKPGSRVPNPAAMQARVDIRGLLVSWAKMVIDECGYTAPADTPSAIAAFLHTHLKWLTAHDAAGDCADEFATLAGRARRIAYPNGTRTYQVAPCPMECEGVINAVLRRTDSLLPSELVCDVDRSHAWNSTQWVKLGRALLGTAA